ncbi:MAG: RNA polymerase sigma factor [Saprospiraceae bacterium]
MQLQLSIEGVFRQNSLGARQTIRVSKTDSVTELEIIKGCIRNDRQCQRALFDRYSGLMLSVCRRYTRHEMEAEDILQDALIKVFKNIEKFKFEGSFEGWVRRIVVNTALKNYKKSSVQKEQIGLESYQEGSMEPKAVANLGEEELMNLIGQLPDGYRVVFNLYVVEGYSHKEIAEMLQVKESTSRSQLVKARRMLQEMLIKRNKISA